MGGRAKVIAAVSAFWLVVGGAAMWSHAASSLTAVVVRAAEEDECTEVFGGRDLVEVEANEDGVSCFYQ